ncbi:MAG: ABC transporter permease subunit [Actinobacteria bacterium]|nr:ABC transporter permease subunit [Actinomycetota bacterium]
MSVGAASPDEFYDAYTFDVEPRSLWVRAFHRFFRHRLAVASLVILGFIFAVGLLAKQLAPYPYQHLSIDALSSPPSWSHPFGTNQVGDDYFSDVLHGLGTEVRIVLFVAFFGTTIGTLIGALSGYFGGLLDNVLMRLTDVLLTMPPLVTLLVAATYLHANTLFRVALLLAGLLWMPVARQVRATCLSIREREYVEAALAAGASDVRIIARHVLPNTIGTLAVAATVMTVSAVILETTIAFLLGAGISGYVTSHTERRLPSLGDVMASASQEGLYNWWGIVFPGLAIVFLIVPIYFIGDGIRDALDPAGRLKGAPRRARRRRRTLTRFAARLLRAVPRPTFPELRFAERAARIPLPRVRFEFPLIERAVSGIRRRRLGRHRFLTEALAILFVTAAAAGAIYVFGVSDVHSPWRVAGMQVQNVSRARGAQTEVTVALAPAHPHLLFAASNDSLERTVRVYGSTDSGRTWSSGVGPSLGLDDCARGEPASAIARDGREYVALVVNPFCTDESASPYLVVASRSNVRGRWRVTPVVTPRVNDSFDAKPALVAAPDGRMYVVWSRLLRPTYVATVVSSTSNGGRTWSKPRVVSRELKLPKLASATVDAHGTLYVAGVDTRLGVWVARSADAGRHFVLRKVGPLRLESWNDPTTCAIAQKYPTPNEATRCLGPNPTVVTARQRVYVTYSTVEPNGRYGVRISAFDTNLRPLYAGRVGPLKRGAADQFWPVSAVDPSSATLWVCYYDTTGDPSRKQAWFVCAISSNGRRWTTPVRAANESARASVLWEDARIYGFGDVIGYGSYPGLVVGDGVAHPMWIDTRGLQGRQQEVMTANLSAKAIGS